MAEHDSHITLPGELAAIRNRQLDKDAGSRAVAYYNEACKHDKVNPAPPHTNQSGEAHHAFVTMLAPITSALNKVQGGFREYYVCHTCRHSRLHNDNYTVMALPLDDRNGHVTRLSQCIHQFFVPEKITDYYCDHCKTKGTAKLVRCCPKLPDFWIMDLKRGTQVQHGRVAKDNRPMDYPHVLEQTRPNSDQKTEYVLRCVLHQIGGVDGGHWFAEVQTRDKKWWRCDDMTISHIKEPCIAGSETMFVYQRT